MNAKRTINALYGEEEEIIKYAYNMYLNSYSVYRLNVYELLELDYHDYSERLTMKECLRHLYKMGLITSMGISFSLTSKGIEIAEKLEKAE